jgi:uncharacterized protein YjiS (DUF1127 family)
MTLHAVTARLPTPGRGLLARLRAVMRARRTAACLAHLDDHLLADIGFARAPQVERLRLVA